MNEEKKLAKLLRDLDVYSYNTSFEKQAQFLIANGVTFMENKKFTYGHWIDHYTNIVCSECGAEYSDEIIFMNRDFEYNGLNYCPNCGAKMDKEN